MHDPVVILTPSGSVLGAIGTATPGHQRVAGGRPRPSQPVRTVSALSHEDS